MPTGLSLEEGILERASVVGTIAVQTDRPGLDELGRWSFTGREKRPVHVPPKHNWHAQIRILLICATLFSSLASCAIPGQSSAPSRLSKGQGAGSPTVSPPRPQLLLYGVNMALYDTQDHLVNDPAKRELFRKYHVSVVRMPFRVSLPDSYEVKALQAIKAIGAVPLVILHGPTDPEALDKDRHIIRLVQSVFGNSTVYVEYGNEPDLDGVDVWHYINSWNGVIPHLKAMVPNYKFIGPVNYHSDPVYIAIFDKYANPRPDLNSWHEYACLGGQPDASCLAQTASWTQHIRATNNAVRSAIGTTLPIMITEWNLDAYKDGRYTNTTFMQEWTALAIQTLAANMSNGLVAAMQYCATNNAVLELVDGTGGFTPEGQTFFHLLGIAGKTG